MKAFFHTFVFLAILGLLPILAQPANMADLQARAAKGEAQAELELGAIYHLGTQGVVKDFAKAAELYRQSAAQGNPKAMYNLGYIYHHGQGVGIDDVVASQWFQKAADLGLPAAELQLGLAYFFGDQNRTQDYVASAKWLKLAVEHKDATAQIAPAANALGSLYEHGWGVPKDDKQALSWYHQGADLDNAKAQFNLGRIYEEGVLVKKDPAESYFWLKLAAFHGDPGAIHLISEYRAANTFTPEQIAAGDKRAREFQFKHHKAPLTGPTPFVTTPETMAAPRASTNVPSATPTAPQPGQNPSGH